MDIISLLNDRSQLTKSQIKISGKSNGYCVDHPDLLIMLKPREKMKQAKLDV